MYQLLFILITLCYSQETEEYDEQKIVEEGRALVKQYIFERVDICRDIFACEFYLGFFYSNHYNELLTFLLKLNQNPEKEELLIKEMYESYEYMLNNYESDEDIQTLCTFLIDNYEWGKRLTSSDKYFLLMIHDLAGIKYEEAQNNKNLGEKEIL